MDRFRYLLSVLSLLFSFFVVGVNAQGDQQSERSFDVVLQIVMGGSSTASQPLPQNLANIAKQLRANYAFAEYRLANTYIGRVSTGGNIEYKSVSNIFGQPQEGETPSFWDWSLSGFRNDRPSAGLFIQGFRFGARIPVRTGTFKDDAGRMQPSFAYESIGINLARLALAENTPTLIGSLALPKTDGTAFLVLTVRPT